MTLLPEKFSRILPSLLMGTSLGVTGTILLVLAQKEPAQIVEMFRGWGPGSLIAIIAVFLVSRGFDRLVDALLKGAASQQDLANAVREMRDRDDREREEQRRLLSFVGTQQEKILQKFEELTQHLEEKAQGAHAS